MKHTLKNGRTVIIPDREIDKLVQSLEISIDDAIDLWLDDNNIETNEIAEELDEKASKVKIERDIVQVSTKKERKKPERQVSDEKKQIFDFLNDTLSVFCEENDGELQILNENKLFSLRIGEKIFKLDLIETRSTKKS